MNPEIYSYIMPKLFELGALDVYYTPIQMKKNRPGIKLSILCKIDDENKIQDYIFEETSTFGIRKYNVERTILEREYKYIDTIYGKCKVKLGIKDGKILKCSPEYEDCKKIAIENNVPIKKVYEMIMKEII